MKKPSELSPDERRRLGLDDLEPGGTVEIEWPRSEAGEARAVRPAMGLDDAMEAVFGSVAAPRLAATGIELGLSRDARRIVKVRLLAREGQLLIRSRSGERFAPPRSGHRFMQGVPFDGAADIAAAKPAPALQPPLSARKSVSFHDVARAKRAQPRTPDDTGMAAEGPRRKVPLSVSAARAAAGYPLGPVHFLPDDPGIAVIDTRRLRDFIVYSARGAVHVVATPSTIIVRLWLPSRSAQVVPFVPPLADIEAPLEEWLAALDDYWLKQEVRSKIRVGGTWMVAVGAGMLTSLHEPADARAASARLLAGQPDTVHAAPRRWARSLEAAERETLVDLALAEIDILHRAIDELQAKLDAAQPRAGWRHDWEALCTRRDDLECVRILLHEAGAADRVHDALRQLDRAGWHLRLAVPQPDAGAGERRRRVTARDPEAWWGAPDLDAA